MQVSLDQPVFDIFKCTSNEPAKISDCNGTPYGDNQGYKADEHGVSSIPVNFSSQQLKCII